jgi:anti-sigma B factor antagonist
MWEFLSRPSEPLGRITAEWDRDGYVLRLAGEIDTATVEAYQEPPLDAPVISVIDLSEVEFLGSSGLAFLVRQTQHARDRGLLPAVRGLTSQTRRILQITGAMTMFQPVAEANGGRSTVARQSA